MTCICTNQDLVGAITSCVVSNCSVVDQLGKSFVPSYYYKSTKLIRVLATTKYSKDTCGVEPVDRTAQVVIVPMVFGALALLAYGVRVVSRCHLGHGNWSWGDWAITAATVRITIRLVG